MATLNDIARTLGIAKSTVSKALNGAEDVSEATRRQVLETAVELGYSRRRGNQPRIAVFITNMEYEKPTDFGHDILVGFRKMAEPAGFQVDVIPLNYRLSHTTRYDEFMLQENYRGALFLGLSLNHPWIANDFAGCKTPTVLYDNRVSGNPNVTYVGTDSQEGMALTVYYLKELGHRKIGYLSSALGAYVYQQRYLGFFQALKKAKLPCGEELCGASYHMEEVLEQHLPRLIEEEGCTAIVCSHDLLAIGAMERIEAMGLRVPEDISILGFDDIPQCRSTTPTLTTIRQSRTEIGKSAFFALSNQMEGVPLSTVLIHAELVKRGSCGPASGDRG